MAKNRYELVFVSGDRAGEVVPLDSAVVTIGRSRSNALLIDDPLVSRAHAKIALKDKTAVLEDLGSSHGTFLNDKRVRGEVSLAPGDIIQIGDAKIRFSAPGDSADEDKTLFAKMEGADEEDRSGATEFAEVSRGSETRFMSAEKAVPEDAAEETRVLGEGETRILDESELKGVRASPAAPRPRGPRMLAAAVLALAAIAVCWFFLGRGTGGASPGTGGSYYTEKQYAFSIKAPAGWTMIEDKTGGALFGFRRAMPGRNSFAGIDVFAERDPRYASTGLQAGFESYLEPMRGRREGMKLDGRKLMAFNDMCTVFFAFSSPSRKGKGIYLISGSKRICVECSCPPSDYKALSQLFTSVLRSCRLTEPQEFIDYPLPSPEMRRLALADKDGLAKMARHDFDIGTSLLKNAFVRPENLYAAKQILARGMSGLSALSERPAFFPETAAALARAGKMLDKAVKDQRFKIAFAESRTDYRDAYWEAVKLQQMVPDKTSEHYQFAAGRIKRYADKIKR